MRRVICVFLTCLFASQIILAQNGINIGYEFWFDNDESTRQAGDINDGILNLEYDLSEMSQGVHVVTLLVKDKDNKVSDCVRKAFYLLNLQKEDIAEDKYYVGYEFWFDDDETSRQAGDINDGILNLEYDLSEMSQGVHVVTLLVKDKDNKVSDCVRKAFYLLNLQKEDIAEDKYYEYWIDNNTDVRQFGKIEGNSLDINYDISTLSTGIHHLNLIIKDADENISDVIHKAFYIIPKKRLSDDSCIDHIYYSYDKNDRHTISVTEKTNSIDTSFLIDLPEPYSFREWNDAMSVSCEENVVNVTMTTEHDLCVGVVYGINEVSEDHYPIEITNTLAVTCQELKDISSTSKYQIKRDKQISAVRFYADKKAEYLIRLSEPIGVVLLKETSVLAKYNSKQTEGSMVLEIVEPGYYYLLLDGNEDTTSTLDIELHYNFDITQDGNILKAYNPQGMLAELVSTPSEVRQLYATGHFTKDDIAFVVEMENLQTIRWETDDELPMTVRNSRNANLLTYVKDGTNIEGGFNNSQNVVQDGKVNALILTDGYPLLIPESFTASTATYSKLFEQKTVQGRASGWKTIVLPYDVQTFTEEGSEATIAPFGATATADKQFWLAGLSSNGFAYTDKMEANVPYIIAMPNSPTYKDELNISGQVRFESHDVLVQATTDAQTTTDNQYVFVPTYEPAHIAKAYAINDAPYRSYPVGSVFVRDSRDLRPFEGYLMLAPQMKYTPYIKVDDMMLDQPDIIPHIADTDAGSHGVYNLNGQRLQSAKSLPTGVYIVNKKKVVVK